MPRLLMVSRTPSLAMGLAGTAFDVVVLKADEASRDGEGTSADVVLIDAQSAQQALSLLERLRDPVSPVPALVLAGPDWDCAEIESLPATVVVVRPVGQNSLVAALNGILAPATPTILTPQAVDLEEIEATIEAEKPNPTPDPAPAASAAPPDAESLAQLPRAEVPPKPEHRRREARPIELVRSLLPHVDQLPWIPETSDAILAQAMAVAAADAGALLLRDDDHWAVTAGAGLRPLELRCELGPEHWLVDTVGIDQRGVLLQDTDIARSHLAGAPLASWRNLMAVPVTAANGILVLARRDDPVFSESDLRRLAELSREASAAVDEAVEVRLLARALVRYSDSATINR